MASPSPSPTSFEQIWSSAFALYKQQTLRNIASSPLLPNLHTVDDVLTQIEASNTAFGTWRSRHERVWGKLSACIGPLQVLGGVGGAVLQGVGDMVPGGGGVPTVLAAVVYLVKACDEVAKSYDLIETLFEELTEFTVRLREYTKLEVGEAMRTKVVATLACMLEIIGRSEELIRTKRFRHFIGVAWFGKDEKTRDALDRFHKLVDSEERLVIAVTYSSVRNTEKNVDTLLSTSDENKQSQKDILEKVEKLSSVVTDGKEENLLKQALWTQAFPKTQEIFADFKENLLEGTCEWLHDEFLFCAWEKEEESLLWVFGGAGAGKSFLATKTILLLLDKHHQDSKHPSRVAVSYYFMKEDNQILHDLNVILKTIAYQISLKDEIYRTYLQSVCKFAETTNTAEKSWKALFLNFYTSAQGADSSAFVVIDGLDEAPLDTRRKFLGLLKVLANKPSGNSNPLPRLQIAFFGRPDLKDDMEFPQQKFVNVNAHKNRKDINDYILSRLPSVRVLKDMKPKARTKFAKEIRSTILQRADGMFFWAKLVLDQICRKERKSEVQQALQSAPRELDRMIRHIFERVAADPDVNIEDLNNILSWISCAKRPLTLGEVHVILKLRTGEPNLSLRRRLRGKFASFFNMSKLGVVDDEGEDVNGATTDIVPEEKAEEAPLDFSNLSDDSDGDDSDGDEDSDDGSDDDNGGKDEGAGNKDVTPVKDEFAIDEKTMTEFRTIEISFSHKRIKDYLVQEGGPNPVFVPPEFPKMSIGINVNESELDLALTCLAILVDGITENEEGFNLVQYAAENFMKHIEEIDLSKISKEDKLRLIEQLTKVFYEDVGVRKLISATFGEDTRNSQQYLNFYFTWIDTNEYTEVLRGCLGEIDSVNTQKFTTGQLEWIKQSVASAKEFFRPLMVVISQFWLSKTGFDDARYLDVPQVYFWLLHGYFRMNDDGSLNEAIEDFTPYLSELSEITLESMRQYAQWAGLDKTAHWHVGLAWIMMYGEYYDAAIAEFKKALEIDSMAWSAQEGLAACYADLDDTDSVLEWMKKAIENLPANLSPVSEKVFLPRVAEFLSKKGSTDQAIMAWKEVWESNIHSMINLRNYICELHTGGRHQDLVAIIVEIDTRTSRVEHCDTILIEFLVSWHSDFDIFDAIGTAFNAVNSTDARTAFLSSCTTAIAAADAIEAKKDKPVPCGQIRMNIGFFKYTYCDLSADAVALWQETIDLIDDYFATSGKRVLIDERKECTNAICQHLFDAATEAKEKAGDSAQWVKLLKDHACLSVGRPIFDEDGNQVYGAGYASMIYGVWLRRHDGAEEAVWKKYFQAIVLQHIDILVKEAPDQKQFAYFILADTLLMADDVPNATAALAVAMKGHEIAASEDAVEPDEVTQLEQEEQNEETAQAFDDSVPAGEAAQDLEKDGSKPADAQGGYEDSGTLGSSEEATTGIAL
ncbi:hypothetical protein V490_07205 [Pseudogymnoascus sp. VKM F-3557]|nr:hypothetical protein V490_07205 [Pseudogymnoascus sp. VKM F-3557]